MSSLDKFFGAVESCQLTENATPLTKFKAYWKLSVLIDQMDPMDLYLSTFHQLSQLEPLLTEADKEHMRDYGCSFPGDWAMREME